MKTARTDFEEQLSEDLAKSLGPSAEKYPARLLIESVVATSEIENVDVPNRSIKADRLIRILKAERSRLDRIDSWNRRQQK